MLPNMGGYHQSSEQLQTEHCFVHNDLKYNLVNLQKS